MALTFINNFMVIILMNIPPWCRDFLSLSAVLNCRQGLIPFTAEMVVCKPMLTISSISFLTCVSIFQLLASRST